MDYSSGSPLTDAGSVTGGFLMHTTVLRLMNRPFCLSFIRALRPTHRFFALLGCAMLVAPLAGAAATSVPVKLSVIGPTGEPVTSLADGNTVRLRARLAQPAARAVEVNFQLESVTVGRCTIAARANQCETPAFATLGWYWSALGQPMPQRTLTASSSAGASGLLALRIAPRPVVLLHGFIASARKWLAYTKANGFLAPLTLKGFAVGDGQADGVMNMGDLSNPTAPTLSIAENAAVLARYIAGVKKATGAEMVDLVAHSMGGLVARYYIARLMPKRDVAQLLMLGTPHGGSDCSALPSALGILMPSSMELRPDHMQQIFNRAITQHHGVPFFLLAGDAIVDAFKAPCTHVPSDLVVTLDSAMAVPGTVVRLPRLHIELNSSQEVFKEFVAPHLRMGAAQFPTRSDDTFKAEGAQPRVLASTQFIQVIKGQVPAGGTTDLDIHLDQVAVAGFALFDPTRTLSVTVRGASGKVIHLNPTDHGLIKIDDPASMVHLGYGFNNPKPGPWRVTLHSASPTSADFALSVRVVGGAELRVRASEVSPTLRDTVRLFATLDLPGKTLTDVAIEAVIHMPDGKSERIALRGTGPELSADWKPVQRGLHGVDLVARGRADATLIERTTLLAIDTRP
jgi:pimeloyl-ACP methyl ester carboxylesterase